MIKLNPEKIKYLIVHHTATSRDRTTFEAVKRYHTQVRGWGDIGYHYFINGKGELKEGRNEQWVGAHCKTPGYSMNFQSLGIALTGNFEIENPAKEQITTLDDLLGRLRTKYNIPKENVLGHKEVEGTSTLCPGKNFLPYLKTYRKRVEEPEPKKKDKRSEALEEIIQILKKYELIP